MADENLFAFIAESNLIEGITKVTPADMHAHETLLKLDFIAVNDLVIFVKEIQPNARLREFEGMNVHVGSHIPPPGGLQILESLASLLESVDLGKEDPYTFHIKYETLHPFTDGNGRSGRALWLWQYINGMGRYPTIRFLHNWYYQSLERSNR